MSKGQRVSYADPKTHTRRLGTFDHACRMRSGFVAAFVKPDGGEKLVTVAVTKVWAASKELDRESAA